MEEKKSLHQNLENVADLLWLSQYMDIPADVQDLKEESSEVLSPDEPEAEECREEFAENDENHHANEEEDQAENTSLDVHTNDKNRTQRQGSSQQKASAFHVPKKLALTHYREWEKAFKFINLKKLSKDKYEFDESKTVENIASTHIFDISFKRVEEKAFSLSVIVDTGETMELWDELLKNFEQMLYTMSVFSHIYVYYWDTKSTVPVLYADKNLKTKISERLVGKEKNNLIWIMSDCLSTSWESGYAFKSIAKWSKKSLTSIVQMFPKEMWMGTMLYKGKQAHFHSKLFNPLNNHLQSSSRRRNKEGLKIPVVSFNPYALQSWARVVVSSHKNIISGIVLENFDFETLENIDAQEISSQMRLKRFYAQATPTAQKLAVYMSVLPVDFQVTRILQEVKLAKSDQSHVAEVYLGGLIEKKYLNHKVHYDFYEGVREGLSVNISADEAFELMQDMSGFVADHLNVGVDFSALIADPSGELSGEHIINDESIAFARLTSNVMKRKGGWFYEKAKVIDQHIETERKEKEKINDPSKKNIVKKLKVEKDPTDLLKSTEEFIVINNPYSPDGDIVRERSMIYGRDILIANLLELLYKQNVKGIILYGQKRVGKSTVFYWLQEEMKVRTGFFTIFFSMGMIESFEGFIRNIVKRIKRDYKRLYGENIFDYIEENEREILDISDFSDFLESVKEFLEEREMQLLILIDEFTYLYQYLKNGKFHASFLKNWKALIEKDLFKSMLIGHNSMPLFFKDYPNELGVYKKVKISYLDKESAFRLIDEPIHLPGGASRYKEGAIELIYKYTDGSPYYIQKICDELVRYLNYKKSTYITTAHIKEVIALLFQNMTLEGDFDNLISIGDGVAVDIEELRKNAIISIVLKSKNVGGVAFRDIELSCSDKMKQEILVSLLDTDILSVSQDGRYSIVVKLLEKFIQYQISGKLLINP